MPAVKTPKKFPGTEKLPPLAQELLQRFFPPDELPTPAVAKLPMGQLRKQGLKVVGDVRTLPSLSGFSPDAVSAVTMLQQKYPRVFGHLQKIEAEAMPKSYGKTQQLRGGRSNMTLDAGLADDQVYNTAAHELAHTAQHIFPARSMMYNAYNRILGYRDNPLEVGARKAGEQFVKRTRNPKIKP